MRKLAMATLLFAATLPAAYGDHDHDRDCNKPKKKHVDNKAKYECTLREESAFLGLSPKLNALAILADQNMTDTGCRDTGVIDELGTLFMRAKNKYDYLARMIAESDCQSDDEGEIDVGGVFKIKVPGMRPNKNDMIECGLRELHGMNWTLCARLPDVAYSAVPIARAWNEWADELRHCGCIADLEIPCCEETLFNKMIEATNLRPLAAMYDCPGILKCEDKDMVYRLGKKYLEILYQYFLIRKEIVDGCCDQSLHLKLNRLEVDMGRIEHDLGWVIGRLPQSARWNEWRENARR